jgi:transposase
VYHVLVGTVAVLGGNARDIRPRPGKKTDKAEAAWIAELLAHGLIRPRFVPPPAISALRELTRTRVALVQTRPQAKNRVHKVLEDTQSKRSRVLTELCGTSGRQMLAALIAGECAPKRLSARAVGRWRHKLPQLALALAGQCTVHHGRRIQGAVDLIALLEQQRADRDQHSGEGVTPLQPPLAPLDSIPGVDRMAAREIMAEIGVEMSRFGSAGRLAAWARVAPGHHDRAGQRRSGRTGTGHRYVRRIWVQCAWAARKTPTLLGRTFRRLAGRLGKKKAAVAIAHTILVLG